MMRKIFILLAAMASCGPAFAADMALPVKAPPPAPAWAWTGFYGGGNVGYSWGTSNSDYAFTDFFSGTPVNALVHSNALNFTGAVGGVQVGYNWQAPSRWVFGIEADWQGSSEKAHLGYSDPYLEVAIPVFTATGVVSTSYDAKILWLGTVRGRIGYAWDRLLIYATGGLAYGDVKISGTANDAGSGVGLGGPFAYNATSPFGASRVNVGWTLGGGIEGALANNWSWKAEYLYVDLGSLNFFGLGPFPTDPETVAVQAKFTDNIVRVGLNYQFH